MAGRPKKESKEIVGDTKIEKVNIKNIPGNTSLWVRSNCYGELQYISVNGLKLKWESFGMRRKMTFEELNTMRNNAPRFYEKNWIIIEGFEDESYDELYSVQEVLEFLQVSEYYKAYLCPKNIDDVFKLKPEDILKKVPNMSSGVKSSILIRANELIENGTIDSLSIINALEKSLQCELTRPK